MTAERIDVMRSSGRGGCEWNPDNNSPAYDNDEHYLNTPATVIVGADGQWRLCDSCARLPRFKKFRTRRPTGPITAMLNSMETAETAGDELNDKINMLSRLHAQKSRVR